MTAERQLREEIAFRQRETDRAEMYERDIQALVVTFNHLQDEVVLNTELKEEVRCVQTLLEAKRAKKRAWKEKCRELSHLVATMKHEGEEWRNIRDAEIKQHKTEVAALIEDIKKVCHPLPLPPPSPSPFPFTLAARRLKVSTKSYTPASSRSIWRSRT